MVRKLWAIILLFVAITATNSSAAQEYNHVSFKCEWSNPPAKTLDELIKQSQYIGLYSSAGSYGLPVSQRVNKDVPIYINRLEVTNHLFGEFRDVVEVQSSQEIFRIPSEYFYIKDFHSELVNNDNFETGFAYETIDKDGKCAYGANFLTGYEYLVFGGANSPAIYQPILSRKYDPLYKEVVKRLRARIKAIPSR